MYFDDCDEFSGDDEDYEPSQQEIQEADREAYDSDSGESIDYLGVEERERLIRSENFNYKSKDGEIQFSHGRGQGEYVKVSTVVGQV